jgi:hypothetical protein
MNKTNLDYVETPAYLTPVNDPSHITFKSFPKITAIGKVIMSITQKIHGTNAQILIYKDGNGELQLKTGKRSQFITPENDNFGFARFIYDRKEEFIKKLGEGRHYGEWAGPGINCGEGLKERTFCLFNWKRWKDEPLPERTTTVPLIYHGGLSVTAINEAMEKLKTEGSKLVPGFMKPEGIVIEIGGAFYKNVFDDEEIRWTREDNKIKTALTALDISYLLQPNRLEKLLSRDERYIREYPISLRDICSDYVKDLEEEKQFNSDNEDDCRAEKKALGKELLYFIKKNISFRAGTYS